MKLGDIVSFLESIAPKALQESYDNSGLIIGDPEKEITNILVCLDVDRRAFDLALQNNCQLIVSHHPAIFRAMKTFTGDDRESFLVVNSIKHDVAIYASHTNFDSVKGGLTDVLCTKIGLKNVSILKKTGLSDDEGGLGRYGDISPCSGQDFITHVMTSLSLNAVRFVGRIPETVSRVAVFNGSYDRDIIGELREIKPQALITGDLKYHDAQELMENGIFTIDAGHYGTERLFVGEMSKMLKAKFPELCVVCFEGTDVFNYHIKLRVKNKNIQNSGTNLRQ